MSASDWTNVSKEQVCPVCGKDHACKVSKYHTVAMCLRVAEGAFKSIKGWHFHRLKESADPGRNGHGVGKAPSRPKGATKAKSYSTARAAIEAAGKAIGGQLVNAWTYRDADGSEVLIVARYALADGEKEYRPFHRSKDGWRIGDPSGKLPLYLLLEVRARPDEPVYVCEGEKAVDAARSIGLLATASAHGAGSASKTDWTPLAGRDVVVLPDHDEPGTEYAQDTARILLQLDPPAHVKIVNLPGLPIHGDIAEYIDARDEQEPEAIRAGIEQLAADTPELNAVDLIGGPVLVCLADIDPRRVDWLWPGRIPMGRITLLVGRPGEGKSFFTTDVAARVTTGSPWPDGNGDAPKGAVILIAAEDDPHDTIRPRLDAHYADVNRVHLLSAVRHLDDDGKQFEIMFTLADLATLESALKQHPDCKLIVVDPIGSFLGGKTDAHRDNEVRGVLAPVARLAEKYGAAVFVVAHRRKGSGNNADETALGSRAFTGIARAVWHLSHDADDKDRRLLLPGKNNLAPEGDGLAFTISGDPPRLCWEREPVRMNADEALAAENRGDKGRPGPEPDAQNAAATWLSDLLATGPVPSGNEGSPEPGTVRHEAKQAGLSWSTVRRAADRLGVRREKSAFSGGWQWRLPKMLTEDAQQPHQPVNLSNLDTLALSAPPGPIFDLSDIEGAQDTAAGQVGLATVPAGWSRNAWIAHLRHMAEVCIDPKTAAEYQREADELERC